MRWADGAPAGGVRGALWLICVALVVALTGCDSYTVTRHSRWCRGAGGSGRCEGSIGSLSGLYPEKLAGGEGDAVRLRTEVAVERGTVLVSVTSPDDTVTTVEAAPQQPAVLEGIAGVRFGDFVVTFEAVDGSAEGLQYTVEYEAL